MSPSLASGGVRARLAASLEGAARSVPRSRWCRTSLRTLHLIAVAALYGGHVYGADAARLLPALLATLATGGAFAAFEVWRAPVWLVQVRGVAVLGKTGLVTAVAFWWEGRLLLLTAAMIVGAVVSHAPGRIRYYSLLHRRVVGTPERG